MFVMFVMFRAAAILGAAAVLFARDGMTFALKHGERAAQRFNFLGIADLLTLGVVEHFENIFKLAQGFPERLDDFLDLHHSLRNGRTVFMMRLRVMLGGMVLVRMLPLLLRPML